MSAMERARLLVITTFADYEDCGCGYDDPGDLCLHHAKMVAPIAAALEAERRAALEEAAKHVEGLPWFVPDTPKHIRGRTPADYAAAIRARIGESKP